MLELQALDQHVDGDPVAPRSRPAAAFAAASVAVSSSKLSSRPAGEKSSSAPSFGRPRYTASIGLFAAASLTNWLETSSIDRDMRATLALADVGRFAAYHGHRHDRDSRPVHEVDR